MRVRVLVLAAFLLAPAPVFANQDPAVTTPPVAAEEGVQPEVTSPEQQAQQAAPAPAACRTVRRSESRLSTRRDRVCTPEPQPQPAEAVAPDGASSESTPAETPVQPQ